MSIDQLISWKAITELSEVERMQTNICRDKSARNKVEIRSLQAEGRGLAYGCEENARPFNSNPENGFQET
jgi:hypothetical protein